MSNALKIPLASSLNVFAQGKVNDAFQKAGQALPCSVVAVQGSIVTVKFEINSVFTLPNVTMPLAGAEYIRYPIQVGDKGVCFPASARLGGMSGIGGGTADLSLPGNLTALVFLPMGNTGFFEVNPQAVVIYGPDGVVLMDTGNQSNITLTPAGIAMVTEGPITATAQGSATIAANGITLKGGATIPIGVVQGNCVCAFTGAPHPQISSNVEATL
ncbi:MAG: hypothetical protein V4447_10630 [Pseudomonadota bacterium]